jgi:hypothetical protein
MNEVSRSWDLCGRTATAGDALTLGELRKDHRFSTTSALQFPASPFRWPNLARMQSTRNKEVEFAYDNSFLQNGLGKGRHGPEDR